MKLWLTQFCGEDGEWRNSLWRKDHPSNATGRDILIVHYTEKDAQDELDRSALKHPDFYIGKQTRVVPVEIPE